MRAENQTNSLDQVKTTNEYKKKRTGKQNSFGGLDSSRDRAGRGVVILADSREMISWDTANFAQGLVYLVVGENHPNYRC